MILLHFGWMVDLAMSIFEFLTKFLVFWHPWVCIRSVWWKWNLKQIEAIPPSLQVPFEKKNLLSFLTVNSIIQELKFWNITLLQEIQYSKSIPYL